MPWTEEDAKKHKADLTGKKAKQWARVANSVLKRMMDKGMTEKEAAGEAIKQANGVVNANAAGSYSVYKNKQKLDYEVNLVVHQEKAHLVIPVVMMVEGVHSGNQGAIYHSIAELGKVPASWNGIPVVINHPEEEGTAVSANSPEIIDNVTVGRVYNTSVDGNKLKAEVWLDEDKLNTICPEVLANINDTKEVEVSLGMFTDNEETEGEWNGEKYTRIATNHRPDHLAILPDAVGACSCEDGCGLGANSKNKDMEIGKVAKELNKQGFVVRQIGNNADTSYNEKQNLISAKLRTLDTKDTYAYMEDLFDNCFIYALSGNNERKLFKQDYLISKGTVEFVGTPVEVVKSVEYEPKDIQSSLEVDSSGDAGVERSDLIKINIKKEVNIMADNKCPKCLEKVNALIANAESKFEETDREWLLTQDEKTLDKLAPVVKEVEKITEKIVEVNKLTPDQTADLAFVANMRAAQRNERIQTIQANTSKELWPDEVLKGMNEDTLKRVFDSVKKEEAPVNYALQANFQSNTGGVEALYPAGVEIKK
jgi:hypothetical protein